MTQDFVMRFTKRFAAGATIEIDFLQSTSEVNVTALFGPSGSGKTTLLRCLAGLIRPDAGVIEFRGQTWFNASRNIALTPQQRDIGFLFQEYALFPHLTVSDNIGFGIRNCSISERHARVAEMLTRFDLQGLDQRLPGQLSGGQQQRVALARVLARRPKLLLLDEPLSALDALLREQLRGELRRTLARLECPVMIVTHDRLEAVVLADQVALMDAGKIQQYGSVQEVFTRPRDATLARLVGIETIASGEIVEVHEGLATVQVGAIRLLAVAPSTQQRFVHVCIKGEDVALQKGFLGSSSVRNQVNATVRCLIPEGPLVRVGLDCGFELTSLITRPACEELHLTVGDVVTAMMKAPAIHLIPRKVIP